MEIGHIFRKHKYLIHSPERNQRIKKGSVGKGAGNWDTKQSKMCVPTLLIVSSKTEIS